ncbi:MAG: S8 family serine peptidase [Planctomycetota bacterium]
MGERVSRGLAPGDTKFVEVRGVREFSGRMIARPIQIRRWLQQGFSQAAARERFDEAHHILRSQDVLEYVAATDEYIISLPRDLSEADFAESVLGTGLMQFVHPDWIVYPTNCPNDSNFENQWHHALQCMQSCDGWSVYTGNPSVSIGICDTGLLTTHEDLQSHRLEGYNAITRRWESQGGDISPSHPHGTWTTGTAAANGNNEMGVSGVGWNLSHRMLKVSDSPSGSSSLSVLNHAARVSVESGDRVSNISYTGADYPTNLETAQYVRDMGGIMVWSAGNEGREFSYRNRDDDALIVVGATDPNDERAHFSNFGSFVDIMAPGVDVFTTDSTSNDAYEGVSGTSFSAPLTSGLCALIWAANPSLTSIEVEQILKDGAVDVGPDGVDYEYGYGRISIMGSLNLIPCLDVAFHLPESAPEFVEPTGGTKIRVEVSPFNARPRPNSGWLVYRADPTAEFEAVRMEWLGNQSYDAILPPLDCGTEVEYYFQVMTDRGPATEPCNAPDLTYTALVAHGYKSIIEDTFETDRGWSVESEDLTDGEWIRGIPFHTGRLDPEFDFDGSGHAFVTGNDPYNSDIDGGPTRLTSPTFKITGADAIITYARWFASDDQDDDRLVVEISNDAGLNWQEVESVGDSGAMWHKVEWRVSDFIDPTATMRLRFTASDNPNNSVTDAGVDAVAVRVFDCGDPDGKMNLTIENFVAGSTARLTAEKSTPNQMVYFLYSIVGEGRTRAPALGVMLDLEQPTLAASAIADRDGRATVLRGLPDGLDGREIWVQAAEVGRKSNVANTVVR